MLLTSTPHCVRLLSFLGNKPPSLLPLPEKSHYNHFLHNAMGAQPLLFFQVAVPGMSPTRMVVPLDSSITAPINLLNVGPESVCPWSRTQNPTDGVAE